MSDADLDELEQVAPVGRACGAQFTANTGDRVRAIGLALPYSAVRRLHTNPAVLHGGG